MVSWWCFIVIYEMIIFKPRGFCINFQSFEINRVEMLMLNNTLSVLDPLQIVLDKIEWDVVFGARTNWIRIQIKTIRLLRPILA